MLLDRFFPDAGAVSDARPPMDWKETRDAHVFRMDVPGLAKDQVTVELVDSRVLRVRGGKPDDDDAAKGGASADLGEEKEEREEEGGNGGVMRWHCRERPGKRAFETQFRLPDDAAADEVRAAMADGVLTVTVPKQKGGGKKRHHGANKPVCCRFWP
jgi:HSP20 family protein